MAYKDKEKRLAAERARRATPEGREREAQKRLRYKINKKLKANGDTEQPWNVNAQALAEALSSWWESPHGKRLGVPGLAPEQHR